MPRLDKKTTTRWVDKNGRRVKSNTPGAKKVTELSTKWYGFGVPGLPPDKGVPLAADKAAAQRMLDDLVRSAERGLAGLPDPKAARTPLAEYVERFGEAMAVGLAGRGKRPRTPSPEHVAKGLQRLRAVLAGCDWATVADLGPAAPGQLARWLAAKLAAPKSAGGFSAQTAEYHRDYARRFAWWLSARANAPVRPDLFADVPGFDPKNNRVHARRDASPEELAAFLNAARDSGKTHRGLTGTARYHLYLTAFSTGFRAEEISHLTPAAFAFAADPPTVTLPARLTKNGRVAVQPLPSGVAAELAAYTSALPPDARIWPGEWWDRGVAAKILRRDLKAAGVPYEVTTPHGPTYLDFHALRHSFVSALANAGVGPKILQDLARHSNVQMTLGVYTHSRAADRAAAVNQLPVVGRPAPLLAHLSRAELEDLAAGLAGLVAVLVAGPVGANGHDPSQTITKSAKCDPRPEVRKGTGKAA